MDTSIRRGSWEMVAAMLISGTIGWFVLGGADLQRRRGAAEPDQPVLYAAAAGGVGVEGAGSDRVFVCAIAGAYAVGVVSTVGVGDDVEVFAAGDALIAVDRTCCCNRCGHSETTGRNFNKSGNALWIVSQTTSRLISK